MAVAIGGTVTALLVTSGVFLMMGLTLATTAGLPGPARDRRSSSGRLRAALRYARGAPLVRALLSLQAASMLFLSIPIPVEVVLADHTLHGGAGGYGGLLSAWGAGAVIGSAIYARGRSLPAWSLIALGACCLGVGYVAMSVAPSLAVAIAGAAVAGVGNGTMFVASRTALQEAVETGWMAMMMSLNESIIQGIARCRNPDRRRACGDGRTTAALAVGGAGALVTGVAVWVALRQSPVARAREPSEPTPVVP